MKQRVYFLFFWMLRCLGKIGLSMSMRPSPGSPRRILLLQPSNLGSMVLATPVIHALRSRLPDVRLTLLVAPEAEEIARHHPDVDEVLTCRFPTTREGTRYPLQTLPQLFRVSRQLRRGRYDLGINLRRRFWWGSALLLFAHIPLRVGRFTPTASLFHTTAVPRPPRQHITTSLLTVASAGLQAAGYAELDKPYTPDHYPSLFEPTHEEYRWVREYLMRENIPADTRLILIHPGTGGAIKMWRTSAWITCAEQLYHAFSDNVQLRFILTGGKREQALLEKVAQGIAAPVTIIPTSTVGRLAALLKQADLVLGVDSGPLHLAVAMGTRTVRIYGPTDPETYGPWGNSERHTVITSTFRCDTCPVSPCNRLHVLKGQVERHPCTKNVPVQPVLDAALQHMSHVMHKIQSKTATRGTTSVGDAQVDTETASFANLALNADGATHCIDQIAHDSKAKTKAARGTRS